MDQEAWKNLKKAKVRLLLRHPFYSFLLLNLSEKEDAEMATGPGMKSGTMATNGRFLWYDPAYVKAQKPDHLMATLAHETLHCALLHPSRTGSRDQVWWNIATDLAVNGLLKEDGFNLHEGLLYNPKYSGLSAEEIYSVLMQNIKEAIKDLAPGNFSQDGSGIPLPFDNHDAWESKEGKEDEDAGEGQGQEVPARSDDDLWKDRLVEAATRAKMAGKVPAQFEKYISELLQPKVDWKTLLRDFVQASSRSNYRLFPPNKRHLWRHMYLPSTDGTSLEIIVGVDTSGSVSDKAFQEFMSEIRSIAGSFDDYTIHVVQGDAAVSDYETLTPHEGDPPVKRKGYGGTDFQPIFDFVEENIEVKNCLIYFTDGYPNNGWPKPVDYPVLWVINTDVVAPWGETLAYDSEEGGY